ncbi:hypothetical protein [Acinetobacter bouvetii]|uniref:Uncharacterized protein n=1 Tax=Acinetobacter bouvetii TaxID=202951 RepID=A0A811GFI5_9GAMM|nr:hypothetical protein [Acinetobacter bouvetii]CAB1222420.1 hypothetical protein SFB21_3109 [Acinetobacter bouvetii]
MTHKKSKIPHSLIQSLVAKGVQEQLEKRCDADYREGYEEGQKDLQALVNADESEKIQKLRLSISSLESQLDQQAFTLSEKNRLLHDATKRNTEKNQKILELERQLEVSKNNFETFKKEQQSLAALGFVDKSFIVHNWRDSWKWLSNWCFGLVMFFAVTPLPPELLAVLPEHIRFYVIAWIAFCGMVGRYINQSHGIKS